MIFINCMSAGAQNDLRESPIVKAVKKIGPAVVNISSEQTVRQRTSPFSGFSGNPLFDNFFRDFFDHQIPQHFNRSSLGSGVIIDGARGYILTNAHVIESTGKITVTLKDEREFEAEIIGADPDSDLAVLKIPTASALPSIEMGTSDDLMIGETVIAIGNPFGFSHTVTTGVISAVGRSIRTDDKIFQDFIQIDASINPGNSGGPLLNINGELIGINTAIYAKAQGIGFAIPINKARRIISDLIQFGEVIQAWIGIAVQPLDSGISQYLDKSPEKGVATKGVIIREIDPDSPSSRAGLIVGDIITGIGNRNIASVSDYTNALQNINAGDIITIHIFRNGKINSVSVKSSVFPEDRAPSLAYRLLGIRIADISANRKSGQAASRGVIITEIDARSHLARIGADRGDIIRQIDDIPIGGMSDFNRAIIKCQQKPSVVILLQRAEQLYHITVKISGQ
ncbi:MAG: trypsin-like peptidase domain-containing protein [Desulfatirhabdiaceae bacterium]